MSNCIQVRRGTNSERVGVVFANGELVWCTDVLQLWVGDGVTPGGRPVSASEMPYVRSAFSNRFNEQVDVRTVSEALDVIFRFTNNVATNVYFGDVLTNDPILDPPGFFAGLTTMQWQGGPKDVIYTSNVTYRTFAYPKSYGPIVDVQDPNFSYASILASYEVLPREVTYDGVDFYVYFTADPCLSLSGKTIRYII
jgi:hypothetical protein